MKYHSIKIITTLLGATLLFAACKEKEIEYNTTHPIEGEWVFQSATAEVRNWGTGNIDTVFDLGASAPWKDMVFLSNAKAVIEVQDEDTVVPPNYVKKTFTWQPGFEESWTWVVELWSEEGFYKSIYIEENSNGILKFGTTGLADLDARNEVCYRYTYSRRQ